jgi:hypothetical protein
MLIDSEFGIWEIHNSFDFNNKKRKFICKSNTKYDDILQIINNNNDINPTYVHDDMYKEKLQLYSLIKHDGVQIIHEPRTDQDILKLDKGSKDITQVE